MHIISEATVATINRMPISVSLKSSFKFSIALISCFTFFLDNLSYSFRLFYIPDVKNSLCAIISLLLLCFIKSNDIIFVLIIQYLSLIILSTLKYVVFGDACGFPNLFLG